MIIGGKFKNPLWEPGDLIWDTDINPEGVALQLSKKVLPKTELFMNTGFLVIDESAGSAADPAMYVIQPGFTQQLTENVSLKSAVSYYGTTAVKGKTLDGTTSTNSNSGGKLSYLYNNVTPAVELGIKGPFKILKLDIPYLALFGGWEKIRGWDWTPIMDGSFPAISRKNRQNRHRLSNLIGI